MYKSVKNEFHMFNKWPDSTHTVCVEGVEEWRTLCIPIIIHSSHLYHKMEQEYSHSKGQFQFTNNYLTSKCWWINDSKEHNLKLGEGEESEKNKTISGQDLHNNKPSETNQADSQQWVVYVIRCKII